MSSTPLEFQEGLRGKILRMLLGQKYNLRLLDEMLSRGQFPHSLLLTGARGTGKKTLAREIARALLCDRRQTLSGEEDSKGLSRCDCSSCRRVEEDLHPDCRWYGLDAEALSIKMAEMRELIHWVGLKPFEGRVKVFILNRAEKLTEEAANALLKTLEEPPPRSYLLLLAESKHNLLETVVSRCWEVRLRSLSISRLQGFLEKEARLPREEARFLARFSQGALGKALSLSKRGIFREREEVLGALWEDRLSEVLENWVGREREELFQLLDLLGHFFRDAWVWKETRETALLEDPASCDRLQSFAETLKTEAIRESLEVIEIVERALLANVNPKIALVYLALRLKLWGKKSSI